MKKKREAKRQAKQMQDAEDSNDDKQSAVQIIDESKDNEKQLRIKKIQSVCFRIVILLFVRHYSC